jgi:NAD(P)-dependent dehydrogenase (short-subunit alcohol dehydrogenase family)
MAEQTGLDVFHGEWLPEQRIVEEIDLPDREIVGRAPIRVYGVDLAGNVWRFDVNGALASGSFAQLFTTLRDAPLPAGQPQAITSKPELSKVAGRPFVYVATGRYLGTSDVGTTQAQTVYAIHDPLTDTVPSNTVPVWVDVRASGKLQSIAITNTVIDGMAARRFGRVVNITSSSVLMPIPGLDLSSGARAGLTAFLTGVAKQVARHNVTVNNILPGKIATDRQRSILKWSAERAGVTEDEEAERQAAAIPAGRFGTPEEFGQVCAFLCSTHAGYITGRNLLVDGGVVPTAF